MTSPAAKHNGFTIIELLVVIVVIAILAAIATLGYSGIRKRAGIAALRSDLSQTAKIMSLSSTLDGGGYPATFPAEVKPTDGVKLTYGIHTLEEEGAGDEETILDGLNPSDFPYYDLSEGISPTDPNRTQIIASRNGVMLEDICDQLLNEGWAKAQQTGTPTLPSTT